MKWNTMNGYLTSTKVYNSNKPLITRVCNQAPIPNKSYRLTNIEKVRILDNTLYKFLLTAPLTNRYKRILVDAKYSVISNEEYTCKKIGWHLDGRIYRNNDNNLYHIYCIGVSTEFISKPIVLEEDNQKIMKRLIPSNIEVYKLPTHCWNTYGEYDWHRGVKGNNKPRLFIRICETNYIKENRK